MNVLSITAENFKAEVINSEKPVLLDFWAEWCPPCVMIGPIVDEIAAEQEAVRVGKVNVEDAPELAETFGITNIPLLLLVKNGKTVAQVEGYRPGQKEIILEMISKHC